MAIVAALLLAAFAPLAGSSQSDLPFASVIIQGSRLDALVQLVEAAGGRVTARLPIIGGVAAEVPAAALPSLRSASAVDQITPDRRVQLVGDGQDEEKDKGEGDEDEAPEAGKGKTPNTDYPEVVNANLVWSAGYTGAGVAVAVLDTGLGNHRGLTKDIGGGNRQIVWADMLADKPQPTDPNGHGTHVAGIIANSEAGPDGSYNGTAPGVTLVGVRVLGDDGTGTYADVIEGLQWVVDHQDHYGIRIVNLSLYAPVFSPYWADPLNQAVTAAWANGLVVVVAAGNLGPAAMSVGVPGNNPYAITVGAFTDNYTPLDWGDDYIPPFSAAGPTLDGFVKPDVVAPGGHIVSPMLPGTTIARAHPELQAAAQYFSMAGTSQATGVVSGIAALILSAYPDLTPDQVKFRLMMSAVPQLDWATGDSLYSVFQQGAGRVSAPDAMLADLTGSANEGLNAAADLAGTQHFEGAAYYDDETGLFRLRGLDGLTPAGYTTWAGGYTTWAGGNTTWAGGYTTWAGGNTTWAGGNTTWAGGYTTWAGGYTTWAGGNTTWAGGNTTWAGGYTTWAGGYTTWAGGYTTWAGGYTTWAGGYTTWAGGNTTWAGSLGDPTFAAGFADLTNTPSSASSVSINQWVAP